MKAAAPTDYRPIAKRRLPHFLFEYLDGGSYGEVTLARNSADLDAVALRQRVMRDVSKIDLSTTLFDQQLAMPVALAPVGLAGTHDGAKCRPCRLRSKRACRFACRPSRRVRSRKWPGRR